MDMCCASIAETMDRDEAEDTAALLKVLADPTRLRVLSMLVSAEGDEVCVCDLTEPLGLSQPTVSHHMKQLREAGFTEAERRGKWIYHRLVPERLEEISSALHVPQPVA